MAQNPHPMYGMGRSWISDQNDAKYPLRAITAPGPARTTPYKIGPILNQGRTSECVVYTFRALLNAEPMSDPDLLNPAPDDLYAKVQAIDGIPLPHDGSNDRAMMKIGQDLGLVESYHWAQTLDEAEEYILHNGPLMCGMPWDEPMFRFDAQGFIYPNGAQVGGHEFLSYWVERIGGKRQWRFENSWDYPWGVPDLDVQLASKAGGTFRMTDDALANLFGRNGDICAPQLKALAPAPLVPTPTPKPNPQPPRHKRWWWTGRGWQFSLTRSGDSE